MIELNFTFFIQLVNFLIILAVLNLMLLRPIRGILQQRADQMGAQMGAIERFNAEAQNKLQNYEHALEKAREEGAQIRDAHKSEGQGKEHKIIEQASHEASEQLDASRQKIASEQETAAKELRKQVKAFAEQATEKIFSRA